MEADNRRTSTRYPVEIDATLRVGEQALEVQLLNLSIGGAFFGGLDKLDMGTQVQVSFRIPTHDETIEVAATTRWSTDLGVGVQFGSLRAREVWSLNKFFESLSA
ncbi:MAG: PilZ domain-containing protein [Deltaproteobacteria bacterium]|nr:PilZ domain-containing protein [Deltaproteobacteria bacterium]